MDIRVESRELAWRDFEQRSFRRERNSLRIGLFREMVDFMSAVRGSVRGELGVSDVMADARQSSIFLMDRVVSGLRPK